MATDDHVAIDRETAEDVVEELLQHGFLAVEEFSCYNVAEDVLVLINKIRTALGRPEFSVCDWRKMKVPKGYRTKEGRAAWLKNRERLSREHAIEDAYRGARAVIDSENAEV